MKLTNFNCEIDADGIALLSWDMPERSMNVIDAATIEDLETVVAALKDDEALKGAVITSGKETFSGGADLTMLERMLGDFGDEIGRDPQGAIAHFFEQSRRFSLVLRALETCGKPVAAALNGTALGGAFELALACHARFAADDGKIRLGLPEVKIGLFPGAGGTQRVPRMIPAADALQLMLKGQQLPVARAKAMKLIDDVVPAQGLVAAAKKWILDGGGGKQPWDRDGFKIPGGPVFSKGGMMTFPAANAIYRRETYDNYPGARAILQCVYDGLQVPMDVGLRIESRYFAHVLRSSEARHMIRSLFISMQELGKLARRPAGVPPSTIRKIGVLGAGFMGAGIAQVSAAAGIEVVLIDRDLEAARRGRDGIEKALAKNVSRGRLAEDRKNETLGRIAPSADYGDLAGCDLVIEAVFEDRAIKQAAIEKAEGVIGKTCVFGSNTSTLPISSLAESSARPENFIGVHFFSPVDKMLLVEIIMGRKTGEEALARALDFCRAIRKTPIVVNDSRGFYTSRVVGTYIREGHLMLCEGVPPAMIENVARMAGMPVGPLSLNDEVALDLGWKILLATKKELGPKAVDPRQEKLLEEMVVKRQRLGRKNGKGFYDYPEKGNKRLWPELGQLAGALLDPEAIDIGELKHRLLAMQALETVRCLEEKVLTDVREADVGSILGFGFAPFSGGTLSYIDGMGAPAFLALCKSLEKKHGPRFKAGKLLRDMARNNETFYGRFAPRAGAQAA